MLIRLSLFRQVQTLFFFSFIAVIGTPFGIVSPSISLVFLVGNRIVKKLLKATRRKQNKHVKVALLARSKLNSLEKVVSKALRNSDITHEE